MANQTADGLCLDKICRDISTPGRKDAYELAQCAIRTYSSDGKAVGRICTALCENQAFCPEEKIDKLKTLILYNCSVVSDQQIFYEYQSNFVEKSRDARNRYQSNPGLALQACDDAVSKGIELQKGVENEFIYLRFQNIERSLLSQKKMITRYIHSKNYSKHLSANQTDPANNLH